MKVEGITVCFGEKRVLEDYCLSLPDEGVAYLSGPSGAGKTTLLRVLAGLLTPQGGKVELPGVPVLLFQEDRLFPGLSAKRQVEAVLPRERRDEAVEWLRLVELEEDAHKLPGELSGGMARRLSLARALAVEGAVYLLDEPFAGVDLERAGRILERLKELGKPVLLTGHAPELAARCHRWIEFSKGKEEG